MATGMARGAAARGAKIAFGDGNRVIWDARSEEVFQNNPNICRQRECRDPNVEWISFFRGNRHYNHAEDRRWVWNLDFRAAPGEFFLTKEERKFGEGYGKGYVLIEPNLPQFKPSSPNKDWGHERYQLITDRLRREGYEIGQMIYGKGRRLTGTKQCSTPNIRLAASVMAQARFYIGPEGGLHHMAAAFGVPGVVLFGGWIPPQVTGYDIHTNLTGGATEACGSFDPCPHCRAALDRIEVDEVFDAALARLRA